jgi:hypothetical protein
LDEHRVHPAVYRRMVDPDQVVALVLFILVVIVVLMITTTPG